MSRFSDIDFVETRRLPLGVGLALLLLLAGLLYGGWRYASLKSALARSAAQLSALQGRMDVPPPPSQDAAVPKPRVQAVNAAIAALNTPWPMLLGAIETVRSERVQLTQLEPQAKEHRMRVVAQAEDMDELIGFMHALAQTPPYVQARPLHQEMVAGTGRMRAEASFELRWEGER